jgi:hypothetical protein
MSVMEQVKEILKDIRTTRNNDMYLAAYYFKKHYHLINTYDIAVMSLNNKIPTYETIRRCRQMIQAKGEYLATSGKRFERAKLSEEYRKAKGVPND